MKVERVFKKTGIRVLKVLDGIDRFRFKRRIEKLKAKVNQADISDDAKKSFIKSIEEWEKVPSFDKYGTTFSNRADHIEDIRDIEKTINRWLANPASKTRR